MNDVPQRRFPARATRMSLGAVLIVFGTAGSGQVPSSATGWNALLQAHVRGVDNGHASQRGHAGVRGDRAQLDAYCRASSAVMAAQFDGWIRNHWQLNRLAMH